MMTNLAITNGAAAVAANAVAASTTAATSTGSTTSGGSAGSGSAASLTQSDFLQLLTAQLKYQTPSNPADPTQLAEEFASISTVDGIRQLNTEISNIQSSTGASQIGQAAGLVGRQVAVAGDAINTGAAGSGAGAFTLPQAAQAVSVNVFAANGSLASTLNLGALPAGQASFTYKGGAANAAYSYQVSATGAAGSAITATPYTVYTVQGVNLSGTSPTLNVAGQATALPVSSVQTVLGAGE
jgi:flagellar basal-body rod modification protein FlgD